MLPIALLIMAVVTFKTGLVAEMFNWSLAEGYIYLPSWVREIGSMMQVWVSVLYITALYCTVLYCTVLYCTP